MEETAMRRVAMLWLAISFVGGVARECTATKYYLDSKTGDDSREGTSAATAWKSLERANHTFLQSGDQLLLRAGCIWEGTLQPHGSGLDDDPIVVNRYGEGPKPEIAGRGRVPTALRLENQNYVEIQNLAITNHSAAGPRDLRGVEVIARDAGTVKHVHLKNLEIHDVNGISDYARDGSTVSKSFGGLITILEGETTPTAWDDFRIENCEIHDVGPIGIVMLSSWMAGQRDHDEKTWFPSRHVVIRGNKIERTARNGLIVRGCVAPLIERNLFKGCANAGSGNACFAFHCEDALFQFNESCFTHYNEGDTDATGFDSDYNCRRSVFQFNYSHDNEYGFMVVCNLGPHGFNDGTIVRYNISQNDGGNVFRFSGAITNTKVYNNTIYVGRDVRSPQHSVPPRIIYQKSWNDGWSDHLTFFNNAIYNACPRAVYAEGKSTNNVYCHNLFFGLHPASEPADSQKSVMNPLFTKPGGAKLGLESAAAAYAALPGAPEFGAARAWENQAKNGFRGGGLDVLPDISPPAGCGPSSAIEKPDAPPTERRAKTGM
jgi:hypothetical protein